MDNIIRKIGDKVWLARCEWKKVKKPCPVCFTKKQVTLILGDGKRIHIPCQYCKIMGFDPSGYVSEYDYIPYSTEMRIDKINMEQTESGMKIEYLYRESSCSSIHLKEEDIFETKEQADKRAKKKKIELLKAQDAKPKHLDYKSYSWNAGYYMGQVKRSEEDVERYKKRYKLCKAKERKKPNA